jgi:hypothetical protein
MSAGDTQPTLPIGEGWEYAQAPVKRRKWPWLVALGIVVVLAVGAWFVAEWVAKDLVTKTIRDQVATRLAMPADELDVEVSGAVIPQLISGTLTEVRIASEEVTFGPFTGGISLVAQDVPIRGDAAMGGATAVVTVDQAQLQALMATVDGFPEETLGLADPHVTISTELVFFGIGFPIGVSLAPSAVDADLVLTPAALQLGGADISAEELRDRFGGVADAVLRDWTVCIAEYLPAAVTLTDVVVDGDQLVAGFDVAGEVITDPAAQANGSCR